MSVAFFIGLFMFLSSFSSALIPILDEYVVKCSNHKFNLWVHHHSGALLIIFVFGVALMLVGG